jgi:mono/diheme cytochrome c family protein
MDHLGDAGIGWLRAMTTLVMATLVMATLGLCGSPAIAADAVHGGDLAKRWCATCHLVEGEQKQARADFSPEKVAYFLLDPHPKMPSFPLSRAEASDIAAYISSLRK